MCFGSVNFCIGRRLGENGIGEIFSHSFVVIDNFWFDSRAEQEVLLRRCSVYSDDKLKIRHSFFRRSKKSSHGYTISHSRESSDSRGDEAGSSIGSSAAAFANGTLLLLLACGQ